MPARPAITTRSRVNAKMMQALILPCERIASAPASDKTRWANIEGELTYEFDTDDEADDDFFK